MLKTKIWEIVNKLKVQSEKFKVEDVIAILLKNRGLKTKKDIDEFLHPKLEDVTVESVGIETQQLKKALTRIEKAIEKKEKIVVFGDYDVDGITGTAIIWESLHSIGANVIPYIPHRVDEGYGLSIKGIENLMANYSSSEARSSQPSVSNNKEKKDSSNSARNDGVGLIITVDNGIVANEAVDFANKNNIDVIITDHHTVGPTKPNAYAIVHTTAVCGAAVGYLLSQEITKSKSQETNKSQIPNTDQRLKTNDHLALVALATVADLVPLTGASRTLLKSGLELLRKTTRPGLLALCNEAKIEPEKIDVYTIGHMIAPRLNAMGRLESAMDSLRLLCTTNTVRAKELAQKLELTNRERQILTSSTVEHAKQQVLALSKTTKILFIHHETYEEGVIGLVAGRLVESFYLPAIVLSKGEKYSKASARSIAGFNIIEAIRKSSDLLVNAGGHPMAAGFTVETEKLELLKEALEQVADGAIDETMLKRILRIDMEIPLDLVSQSLYNEIAQLAPFGMACPEPVFMSEVVVRDVRQIGMDGKHLKLRVSPVIPAKAGSSPLHGGIQSFGSAQENNGSPIRSGMTMEFDAIAFGMGEYIADLKKGNTINLAYTIDENTWNGKTNLQLKVKDIQKG